MVNFREVLRRFIKYALMMVIVTLASVNITDKKINNMEFFRIIDKQVSEKQLQEKIHPNSYFYGVRIFNFRNIICHFIF